MCQAIRFIKNDFTHEELQKYHLKVNDDEVRIYFIAKQPYLPVLLNGQNRIVKWGNRENIKIPRTGFCKIESFEAGKWLWLHPRPINILASSALTNGVWFQVKEGIQGLLIKDERGIEHCYMLTQPSTHYFRTMTGSERMPVLIHQVL